MKSLYVLALCLVITFSHADEIIEPDLETQAEFVLEGVSGFWAGFQIGLFHESKKTEDCLDAKTKADITQIMKGLSKGFDPAQMFQYFQTGMEIFNSFNNCKFDTTLMSL